MRPTSKAFAFDSLEGADLIVDAVYEGGTRGNTADDPLSRLLPCGNQGGFRYHGSPKQDSLRIIALYSSGADRDWPDSLDRETGLFTYFGDNRAPGKSLHDTPRNGNVILSACFERLHSGPEQRALVPPFFIFTKANPGPGRAVRFLGLAVPGAQDSLANDDLVAVWRTSGELRFQNYRATFTILDIPKVSREWIAELQAGVPLGPSCPAPFRTWVDSGTYEALASPRVIQYRTKEQQLPNSGMDRRLVEVIYRHFHHDPWALKLAPSSFGKCKPRDRSPSLRREGPQTVDETRSAGTTLALTATESGSSGRSKPSCTPRAMGRGSRRPLGLSRDCATESSGFS